MASLFSFIQYLIKEHFVYAMALYTVFFIAITTLFLKYKINRHRNNHAQAAPNIPRVVRRPIASIHGNKLLFPQPNSLAPFTQEFINYLGKTYDVYIVTQIASDDEEKLLLKTFYSDPNMKEIVKEHVLYNINDRG